MMKRAFAFATLLLLGAVVAIGQPASPGRFSNSLLEDTVQMSRAGLSDATIVAYLKARQIRLDADITAEDLIRLQRAGVSEAVVRYVAGATGLEAGTARRTRELDYDSSGPAADRAEPSAEEDYAYDSGYPYGYWYGYYPYWYAYSPYISSFFFIGGGGFGHHRFGHGRFHGGFHGGHHGHGHR